MLKLVLLAAAVAYGDYCFSEPGGVRIRVAPDGDKIHVTMSTTTQWVGFGVPKSANFDEMGLGNFVVGGGGVVYDRTQASDFNGRPWKETEFVIANSSRIEMANGFTNISFSRLLAPPGGNVIDATKPFRFLWASGTINPALHGFAGVNYHANNRGSFVADLVKGNCAPVPTPAPSKPVAAPPTPAAGKAAKAKNAKNPKAKAAKGKTACTGGKVACTAALQKQGLNCILNSCVSQPVVCGKDQARCTAVMQKQGANCIVNTCVPQSVVTVSNFVPYPGTNFSVTGSVVAAFIGSSVSLQYDLHNIDPKCTSTTSAANSCGLHIHVGKTCSNATEIGGHFYAPSTAADPWLPIAYVTTNQANANGMTSLGFGSSFAAAAGRAVVVHDQNGTRMACALLIDAPVSTMAPLGKGKANEGKGMKATQEVVTVTNFGPYPGTSYAVSGTVIANFVGPNVSLEYDFHNVDARCTQTTAAANSCGLHIHVGKTCSNATEIAGHYYAPSIPVDPWIPISYKSDNQGNARGAVSLTTGSSFADSVGRAVVVHDQNGTRMACALLAPNPSASPAVAPPPSVVVTVGGFVPYPGTNFSSVQGMVALKFVSTGNATLSLSYDLTNTDKKCSKPSPGVANSCGLHIHVGKTCTNATEIAGHYYDAALGADPWLNTVYASDDKGAATGSTSVQFGYSYELTAGRAVVVHDQSGARMACALIPQGNNP